MSSVRYHIDDNKIAHLIFDRPDSPVNIMDFTFGEDYERAVDELLTQEFIGIVLVSTKSTFFAGGDLALLSSVDSEQKARELYKLTMRYKATMRKLETCARPVVACINGSALGGGFEVVLPSHYRIALSNPKTRLGLPEVNWGLLPGAGGCTRVTRILGIEKAMPLLTQGILFTPRQGLENGLIDKLASSEQEMLNEAFDWIKNHPEAVQPWDKKGYRMPGGGPNDKVLAPTLFMAPALVRKATHGTLPSPEAVISVMVEGALVDFDTACVIESRYFVELARSQVAKNLIGTFWFNHNEIKAGKSRPAYEKTSVKKVGVLGAGMMGAGIAYACASKGIEVILKDVSLEKAEQGKNYSRDLLQKRLAKGRIGEEKMDATLRRIHCTESYQELKECDLVIEAVFENRELKAQVTSEAEAVLGPDVVFGSNTSTLPITGLAKASNHPENFVGIHFFSPVDKMPLVEIIRGDKTSDKALATAFDFAAALGKTPIVVNDSRGFYTSRVFATFVKEGAALLKETSAAEVENAAWLCGFPVGPLAVTDEVSLSLIEKIDKQTRADLAEVGCEAQPHPGDEVIAGLIASGRLGKLAGAGFYDYSALQEKQLWPELGRTFNPGGTHIDVADIKERLLFIMALETVRCLDEGVLNSVAEANIGAVLGIGYPKWTGGTLQYINQYGVSDFVVRAHELAAKYGERFLPPDTLTAMAKHNERF